MVVAFLTNSQPPMTIDEAADLAAKRAFIVRTQAAVTEQSRQRLAESRAGQGVQVGASGSYTRFSQPQAGGFGTGASSPSDTRSATISAEVPIDISGRLRDQVRASNAFFLASRKSLHVVVNDAKLAARQAFIAVLRAQASVRVARQTIANAQSQLEQSEDLLREEAIALIDVTRYRAQLGQYKSNLIQRDNELQATMRAFNQSLALPVSTPVLLADVSDIPLAPTNPDDLERSALDHRPEVQALRETLKAQGYTVSATKAGLRPSLTLSANYQPHVGGSAGFGAMANTGSVALTLNIPLFDSGLTKARVRAARQDEVQARIDLERTALAITQEVRDAVSNQVSAEARLRNAHEQQALAEKVYELAIVRRQSGLGTYVDVIDAETSLAQARNEVVSARYDYLLGVAQLQRAVGDETSAWGGKA